MIALPQALLEPVGQALASLGDPGPLRSASPVSGGCIHHALRLETGRRAYFLKWSLLAAPDIFEREADGLRLLGQAQAVRIPEVLFASRVEGDQPGLILMEWLEIDRSARFPDPERFAIGLAQLHHYGSPQSAYGLDQENYIGSTPQPNQWTPDWVEFFREQRLRPQIRLAERGSRLPPARRERLERVLGRLDEWLGGVERRPALLHGDLWAGNVLALAGGEAALIDPAAHFGDREAEIAFTELFGGFSERFYQAYRAAWPLEPGYRQRRDLYNLYHLLNHLNLFGESYGREIDEITRRYVG